MKSDNEFRLEIAQLKHQEELRLRAVLRRAGELWIESDQALHKRVLTARAGSDTLN